MIVGFIESLLAVCHLFSFWESSFVVDFGVVPKERAIFMSVFMHGPRNVSLSGN